MMAHILVIDDDTKVRSALKKTLSAQGHDVSEAADGAAAVRLIEEESIDLVITDMHMPNMDGIEIVTYLREREDCPKILAISGGWSARAGEEVLLDAKLLGADQILPKPFTFQKLQHTVETLLDPQSGE
jgi:two-component system KDP operon response regulator KdpE